MKEVVKIETLCGCSDLREVTRGCVKRYVLIAPGVARGFEYTGNHDKVGRRIFEEVIDERGA